MADPSTGCRCGSGAHPRKCDLHPEQYRLHLAELNLDCYVEESEGAEAAYAELIDAIQGALIAGREREATLAAEVRQLRADNERLRETMFVLVYWHDNDGHVDESWWDDARAQLAEHARGEGDGDG